MKTATFYSVVSLGFTARALAQSPTTVLPPATGTQLSAAAIVVNGQFDGGMKLYDRSRMSLAPGLMED